MKKLIVICPHCKNKMKILYKVGKYRCPSCKEIYTYTKTKYFFHKLTEILKYPFLKLRYFKNLISLKYKNAVSSYKYIKQMKNNMKNNPNWSNYYKEKEEERVLKEAQKPKFWDKFKKNK